MAEWLTLEYQSPGATTEAVFTEEAADVSFRGRTYGIKTHRIAPDAEHAARIRADGGLRGAIIVDADQS
jgi:hypothetical protein